MKKVTLIIITITLLSKILGFLRDIVLSYYYGTSGISDAYIISLTIPGVIFSFIAISIKTGFIPIYTEVFSKNGENKALNFTNNLINLILILCTVIIALCLIYMEQVVKIFASGFEGETLSLAVFFSRLSIMGVYFTFLVNVLSGFLQIKGKYIATVLIGFPLNLIFIISIILSAHVNLIILPLGTILAYVSQLLILLPFLKSTKYQYDFKINLKDPHLRAIIVMSLPLIIGASLSQINILIDRTIASNVDIGGISALNYADRLNLFVQGIAVTSISTVFFPILSKLFFSNKISEYKSIINKSLIFLGFIMIPSSFIFMVFSEEIVSLLFGRGAFDNTAIIMTSSALFYYSIGMLAIGCREVFANSFYAMKNTKIPVINAAIGLIINIILSVILSKYMGIAGIAFATSISSIITAVLMFFSLRKVIGTMNFIKNSKSLIKIIISSILMIFLMKFLYDILELSSLKLLLILTMGAVIYLLFLYLLKLEELKTIILEIRKKIK